MVVSEDPGVTDNVKNQEWGEPEYIACVKLGMAQGTLARLRKENRIPRDSYILISKSVTCEVYRYNVKKLSSIIEEMRENGEIKQRKIGKKKRRRQA